MKNEVPRNFTELSSVFLWEYEGAPLKVPGALSRGGTIPGHKVAVLLAEASVLGLTTFCCIPESVLCPLISYPENTRASPERRKATWCTPAPPPLSAPRLGVQMVRVNEDGKSGSVSFLGETGKPPPPTLAWVSLNVTVAASLSVCACVWNVFLRTCSACVIFFVFVCLFPCLQPVILLQNNNVDIECWRKHIYFVPNSVFIFSCFLDHTLFITLETLSIPAFEVGSMHYNDIISANNLITNMKCIE